MLVCFDELIIDVGKVEDMIWFDVGCIVNIKLGCVGGFIELKVIYDVSEVVGLLVWCGGMLESGVGCVYNVVFVLLLNFKILGDVSLLCCYWVQDVVLFEWDMDENGMVCVLMGLGFGVMVNVDCIDDFMQWCVVLMVL